MAPVGGYLEDQFPLGGTPSQVPWQCGRKGNQNSDNKTQVPASVDRAMVHFAPRQLGSRKRQPLGVYDMGMNLT